jgi:hypothetical protein
MKMSGTVALAVGLLMLGAANADDFSGVMLYRYCDHHEHGVEQITCAAFIHGLLDGLALGSSGNYCFPSGGVSVTQGRLIIEKFMRDRPETLHEQAGFVASRALMSAFPCQAKGQTRITEYNLLISLSVSLGAWLSQAPACGSERRAARSVLLRLIYFGPVHLPSSR